MELKVGKIASRNAGDSIQSLPGTYVQHHFVPVQIWSKSVERRVTQTSGRKKNYSDI